jgi:hypothetical protein
MKKTRFVLAAAMLATSVPTTPVLAQDASLPATGGSVSLSVGFTPDPYTTDIAPGGGNDASALGYGCSGMIAEAPDFSLTYEAGAAPLIIKAISSGDTTLVINTPTGAWACDDDSAGDYDPQITFGSPESGRYDIWVGALDDTSTSTLVITEVE